MHQNNLQIQFNLTNLLQNTHLQLHQKKQQSPLKLALSSQLLIKMFTKNQQKLNDHISYCFNKLKLNMKSQKTRDLIYQAIQKSMTSKLKNQPDQKNQREISKQLQNTKNLKSLETNYQVEQIKDHPSLKIENHVQIAKRSQSAKQYMKIKFSSICNEQYKKDDFNYLKQFTVKKTTSKTEQNQKTIKKRSKTKKNNSLRFLNFEIDNLSISKKQAQQIYFLENIDIKKKEKKRIRFTKIPLQIVQLNSLQLMKNESFIQKQNKSRKFNDNKLLTERAKSTCLQASELKQKQIKIQQNCFKLYLSNKNMRESKSQDKVFKCKYCNSIDKTKKLIAMYSDKTFSNNSRSNLKPYCHKET